MSESRRPVYLKPHYLGLQCLRPVQPLPEAAAVSNCRTWCRARSRCKAPEQAARWARASEQLIAGRPKPSMCTPPAIPFTARSRPTGWRATPPLAWEAPWPLAVTGAAAENGNTPISVTSTNFSETFAKGAFSISLGEASLYATVTVNGRQYLVAKELAVALSRGTPSGTSASTYVSATSPDGGSYSTTQVIVTKSGSH